MSIARWMKKAAVIPICIGILLSHKKEHIRVTSIELDEPRVCYTEWSKWEREKQILYINGCIRNLEKRYWWTCFQGRNRDTDIENRLWTQQGKEREGQIERAALTYIHVCVCACMHVHGCVCACMRVRACVRVLLNHVWPFTAPWTVTSLAPSMGFSRPEYWGGWPFPSPGGSSQPGAWTQVSCAAGSFVPIWAPREAPHMHTTRCEMHRQWESAA